MKKSTNRKLVAILFTDIEGFSLISSNNQGLGLVMVRRHRQVIQNCANRFGGNCINFYGDGSLSLFDSAMDAIRAAIEMQAEFNSENSIPVRIGIHLGEVFQDENSAYGDAINIASRIQNISSKGGILVSNAVKTAIGVQNDVHLQAIGKEYLKNIKKPISLFSVVHPSVSKTGKGEVHQKAIRQNVLQRHQWNLPIFISILFLTIISGLSSYVIKGSRSQLISDKAFAAKLAVMPFDNLTGIESDSFIGKMVSKVIISGLKEIEGTNVISYAFLQEYKPKSLASVYQPIRVPKISKAINLIHGEISKENDSIVIQAYLINLETGNYLHVFPESRSPYDQPLQAIKELECKIKGYWESKEVKPLAIPNHDAYKYYMLALDAWITDDSLAFAYLDKSIQEDSLFLDSYLMKLDLFYNQADYQDWKNWYRLITLKFPMEKLNKRQQNIIRYDQADIDGKNVLAYKTFLKEFEYNPEELFSNTNMALLGMEYVNDPRSTLTILKHIDSKEVDYHSCSYCIQRLDLEIRALLDLGKANEAVKLTELYPYPIKGMKSNQLVMRALIMSGDTATLYSKMRNLEVFMKSGQYGYLNYLVAKDAHVLNLPQESKYFAQQALTFYKDKQFSKTLINIYFLLSDYEEALSVSEHRWQTYAHVYDQIQIALYNALLGKEEKAIQLLGELEKKVELKPYGYVPYYLSHVYTALGDEEKAIQKIEQSLQAGKKFNLNRFHWDALLKKIHEQESFKQKTHLLNS